MGLTQLLDIDREYDSIAHGLYEADRQLDRAAVKKRPARTDAIRGVLLRRCYSISSGGASPGARPIEITVRRVPGGRASTALHQLRRGAVVGLGTPAGDFVLDAPVAPKLLLVGGGSGITPIMAMIRDLADRVCPDLGRVAEIRPFPDTTNRDRRASRGVQENECPAGRSRRRTEPSRSAENH